MTDYVTVSGAYNEDSSLLKMFDKNKAGDSSNLWHSKKESSGWVEVAFPSPKLLTAVIITRRSDNVVRYKNVCLSINGDETNPEICTDSTGYGEPLLRGNEIHFEIMPTLTSSFKLQWGDYNDNYAQIGELELRIEDSKLPGF